MEYWLALNAAEASSACNLAASERCAMLDDFGAGGGLMAGVYYMLEALAALEGASGDAEASFA